MIFTRGRMRAPELGPGEYLRADIDADGAASLLGVSAARWRQLTGSRADPNPDLLPVVTPGVRGARWRVRDVFSFAVTQNRRVAVPVPALLPLADGARYCPAEAGRAGALPAAELSARSLMGEARVWAQLFHPRKSWLCEWAESPVVVMTPLHPYRHIDVHFHVSLLVREALQVPGWSTAVKDGGDQLTVVLLPTVERMYDDVHAVEVDSSMLEQLRVDGTGTALRGDWISKEFVVPPGDVASCLGWPALPWWPEGTATGSACAQWEPGKPVVIDVPESLRDRQMVARWLMRQRDLFEGEERADFEELARMLDPARNSGWIDPCTDDPGTLSEDGFELACYVQWLPVTPDPKEDPVARATCHPFRAAERVLSNHKVPRAVADVFLREGPGDPLHAMPAYYRFADLPSAWQSWIIDSIHFWPDSQPRTSPRWTRLDTAHQQAVARSSDPASEKDLEPRAGTWGPLISPVLLGEHGFTFLAPTGYCPPRLGDRSGAAQPDEYPAIAVNTDDDPIREVLVLNTSPGQTRGLYRTDNNVVGPLPAASLWRDRPAGHIAALIAAFTDTTPVSPFDRLESTPMGELCAKANIALIEEATRFRTRALESLAALTGPS